MRHIFHPTDFSRSSQTAFYHALKLALACRAELRIMHVYPRQLKPTWSSFPAVRQTLARWGLIPPRSAPSAVARLGLRVVKVQSRALDPLQGVLRYLSHHPPDLIVLATHQRKGLARFVTRNLAEPLARASHSMTLFLPDGSEGIVGAWHGEVSLRRVLIPVCEDPDPQRVVSRFAELGRHLGVRPTVQLLHVGSKASVPVVQPPRVVRDWTWAVAVRGGDVTDRILAECQSVKPDLLVMGTKGHKSWADVFTGSTTERVLREVPCAILAIPDRLRPAPGSPAA